MTSSPSKNLDQLLAERFGATSALAAESVAVLVEEMTPDVVPADWRELFGFSSGAISAARRERMANLLARVARAPAEDAVFFAVHSYLALVLKLVVRQATGVMSGARLAEVTWEELEALESGRWMREACGVANLGEDGPFAWYLRARSDRLLDVIRRIAGRVAAIPEATYRRAARDPRDIFDALYAACLPRTVRRALGEHYTPRWLAEHLVAEVAARAPLTEARVLDPSCGSGQCLLAVLRHARRGGDETSRADLLDGLTGYDLNPLAVLAARCNLLLGVLEWAVTGDETFRVAVEQRDALEASGARFDVIVGNPPWVNWQRIPAPRREQLRPMWEAYGLFVHSGFDTILGKGKKEFATLFTAAVADHHLREGGVMGLLITQSVWKSAGASAGFRRLSFGGRVELAVEAIEDLSAMNVFPTASTRTTFFVARKGGATRFPVRYLYWRRRGRRARLDPLGQLNDALEHADRVELAAEPFALDRPESPWITAKPDAIQALRGLIADRTQGEAAYRARQGVNTGGGNAVFWMRVLDRGEAGRWTVENIVKGAKRKVGSARAQIEPDHIYELIRGRDVRRWRASGDRHLLMVQDIERRRGISRERLSRETPATLAYLERFEGFLRQRALFRRYFMRDGKPSAPWWSMFGVGPYTMRPWKVVWAGQVATELNCAVIGPREGELPLPDQTAYYVAVDSEREANFVCGLLNSSPVRLLYRSFLYKHVSLHFIEALDLPRFDAEQDWMAALADAVGRAREAARGDDASGVGEAEGQIDALTCDYWGVSEQGRRAIEEALDMLG